LIVNLPGGAAAAFFLEAILEDLPYLLAHLRGDEEAMTLEQIIRQGEGEEAFASPSSRSDEGAQTLPAPPEAKPGTKSLKAEEFAAFLRRSKGNES
jgi:hypothetical protein